MITEGGFVDHLFTGPDGRPWAMSGRDFFSFDGSNWERNRAGLNDANRVLRWGEAFVATRWGGSAGTVTSGDAVTWEPLGASDLLGAGTQWMIHPITTRGSALAMAALSENPHSPEPTREVSVERDGHTLNVGERLTIRQGEAIRVAIPRFSQDTSNLDVDFDRREVTFLDDEGRPLVTFGFDELAELEAVWFSMPLSRHRALILTDDGIDWTVQDLNQPLGEDGAVGALDLTDATLFAAVTRDPGGLSGSGQPTLEIWVAPLPGR